MAGLGDTTSAILLRIATAIESQHKAMDAAISDIRERQTARKDTWLGKAVRDQKAAEEEAHARVENAKKVDDATKSFKSLTVSSSEFQDNFNQLAKSIKKDNIEMGKEAHDELLRLRRLNNTVGITKSQMEDFTKTLDVASEKEDKVAMAAVNAAKELKGFKTSTAAAIESIKAAGRAYLENSKTIGAGMIFGGLVQLTDSLEESMKRQAPLMDLTAGNLTDLAAAHKLSASELLASTDQYTSMILKNAKDGSSLRQGAGQYLQTFDELSKQARDLTGNYDDGNKLVMASFNALSDLGVDTTFDSIKKPASELMKSFQSLARLTNTTSLEMAEQTKILMQDSGVRLKLLGLDKADRLNFVNKLVQEQELLALKGLEADQVMEAIKSIRGLAETDPRQVYKDAATIMQSAAAMGMENIPDLMSLMLVPEGDRDKDWMNTVGDFSSEYFKVYSKLREGEVADNMVGWALMEKGQGATLEVLRKLNTAAEQEVKKATGEATTSPETKVFAGAQSFIDSGYDMFQQASAYFKDPSAYILAGITSLFAPFLAKNIGLLTNILSTMIIGPKTIRSAFGKVAEVFKNNWKKTASWMTNEISATKKVFSNIGKSSYDIINNIKASGQDVLRRVSTGTSMLMGSLSEKAGKMLTGITAGFDLVKSKMGNLLSKLPSMTGIVDTIKSKSILVLTKMADMTGNVISTMNGLIDKAIGKLSAATSSAFNAIKNSKAGDMFKGLFTKLAGLLAGLKAAVIAMTVASKKMLAKIPMGGALAKGAGILGAAAIGIEIGNQITDFWKGSDPSGYNEASMNFGKLIDQGLSTLGNDAATERLEMLRKLEEMQQQNNNVQREVVDELKKGNEKTDKTNTNLEQSTDENRKGNVIREKQSSVESVRLRTMAVRSAFPAQPSTT